MPTPDSAAGVEICGGVPVRACLYAVCRPGWRVVRALQRGGLPLCAVRRDSPGRRGSRSRCSRAGGCLRGGDRDVRGAVVVPRRLAAVAPWTSRSCCRGCAGVAIMVPAGPGCGPGNGPG